MIDYWPGQTTGGETCYFCHGLVSFGAHGLGICRPALAPVQSVTTYVGVTPDQVRQIVREELERALGKIATSDPGEHA